MDISIVDHWFLSWFRNVPRRRIDAATSVIFRVGMDTLQRPSSPQQQYLWPDSLYCVDYGGVRRISGYFGGLHHVYFVKYFPRAERAFRRWSAPAFCTALGDLVERYLNTLSSVCFILTVLAPLMDISIVDHWCLSWF